MIKIASSVNMSFMFPADQRTTFTYFSDIPRLVQYLHHIDLAPLELSAANEYRLCYHTLELAAYHIIVYCDIRVELDDEACVIRLLPINNFPPVETKVTINSTTTRGYYASEGYFFPAGDQTRVEYHLSMNATPPRPIGMKFVPMRLVDSIAQNITRNRMKEIADGFIYNSLSAFPAWQEALGRHS